MNGFTLEIVQGGKKTDLPIQMMMQPAEEPQKIYLTSRRIARKAEKLTPDFELRMAA